MLEFVLSAMVLVILFAVMANCALLLGERITMATALREAGREAAVTGSLSKGINVGKDIFDNGGIESSRYQIRVYQAAENLIAAEATCKSPVLMPLIGGLMGNEWSSFVTFNDVKYFRVEDTPKK